ncbi:MAG: hypothetical protein NT151_12525 [Acidobacteria bacterium]|nr:hypothetical protein [Acidobacteriota bacterium]
MFAAKRHLDDNTLVRRYLAERGLDVLEAADEPLLRHLAHCSSCHARYGALSAALDESRDLAVERVDAAFTADRLAHQRERIMRRIEAQNGARILAFPAAAPAVRAPLHARPVMRWVAAAAIAGVMVGVTAGRYLNVLDFAAGSRSTSRNTVAVAPGAQRSVPVMRAVGTSQPQANDDEFLSEVDGAIAEPRTSELAAIYALTLQDRGAPRLVNVKY